MGVDFDEVLSSRVRQVYRNDRDPRPVPFLGRSPNDELFGINRCNFSVNIVLLLLLIIMSKKEQGSRVCPLILVLPEEQCQF